VGDRQLVGNRDGEIEPVALLERPRQLVVDFDGIVDLDAHDPLAARLVEQAGDLEARDAQPLRDLALRDVMLEVQAGDMGFGDLS
jgi:hypothetical protein